jgi:hypothetical protein
LATVQRRLCNGPPLNFKKKKKKKKGVDYFKRRKEVGAIEMREEKREKLKYRSKEST